MKPESRPGSNFIFHAHTIAAATLAPSSAQDIILASGEKSMFCIRHRRSDYLFSHSMRARWANASLVCCTYFLVLAAEARPASIFRLIRHWRKEPARALIMCVFSLQAHLTLSWRRRSRSLAVAFLRVAGKHHDSWFHVCARAESAAESLMLFCIIFAAAALVSTRDGKVIWGLITARLP